MAISACSNAHKASQMRRCTVEMREPLLIVVRSSAFDVSPWSPRICSALSRNVGERARNAAMASSADVRCCSVSPSWEAWRAATAMMAGISSLLGIGLLLGLIEARVRNSLKHGYYCILHEDFMHGC